MIPPAKTDIIFFEKMNNILRLQEHDKTYFFQKSKINLCQRKNFQKAASKITAITPIYKRNKNKNCSHIFLVLKKSIYAILIVTLKY